MKHLAGARTGRPMPFLLSACLAAGAVVAPAAAQP
jgi:hypothetical protein